MSTEKVEELILLRIKALEVAPRSARKDFAIEELRFVLNRATALASAKIAGEACKLCNGDGYFSAGGADLGCDRCAGEREATSEPTPVTSDTAIPAGMVPWHGGDAAPADWDRRSPVLYRDGRFGDYYGVEGFAHKGDETDIIAYTPKPTPAQSGDCSASPDHADIMETIANASDDWQKHGYTSALAEVRDMANVGRALMGALPVGYSYNDCPSEIVADLQNERDAALAAPTPEPSDGQDRKFAFRAGRFVNRVSGEAIPFDEPVIIFRARDHHALPLLREYLAMASDPHHQAAISERIAEFSAYALAHPERMKEPGITRAIRLNDAPEPSDAGMLDGWRDIASAPKDGTAILLWLPTPWTQVSLAHWSTVWHGWIEDDGEEDCIGALVPTHWRHLPPPPLIKEPRA
ncbi:MAG TPA: hypothetical protein VF695_11110 [Sphingomonas sp.]|jgi:hypothetical protein